MLHAIQLLIDHGLSGYLMIITGVFAILVSVDRIYHLYFKVNFDAKNVIEKIQPQIISRNYSQALQICNTVKNSAELNVIKEGLMALESGREAINSAITSSVMEFSRSCEKRLSYLSLIASAATLIGLFGTIMGLIKTFEAIAGADPAEKGKLLGLGISEAMHSTAAGVIVGVFAMVVHTVCVAKTDSVVGKAQDIALKLVKWIEQSERGS